MLEEDYQALVDGLSRMKQLYHSMLSLAKEESRIIKGDGELNRLIDTESKKLEKMRQIAKIDEGLAALKSAWQAATPQMRRSKNAVGRLLSDISRQLRELLRLDFENGQLLGKIAGKVAKKAAVATPKQVAVAYNKTTGLHQK